MARHLIRAAVVILAIGLTASGTAAGRGAQAPAGSTSAAPEGVGITYFIGVGTSSTGFRASDRQLAQWALDTWQRSVSNAFRFVATREDEALVRVYWADGDNGQYGEMRRFTVGERQGAAVYIRPDMNALGEVIAGRAARDPLLRESIVYLTCVHELGHALGLSHTANVPDIMYFFGYGGDVVEYFSRYRTQLRSRDDIPSASGLSDDDVRRVRALYVR